MSPPPIIQAQFLSENSSNTQGSNNTDANATNPKTKSEPTSTDTKSHSTRAAESVAFNNLANKVAAIQNAIQKSNQDANKILNNQDSNRNLNNQDANPNTVDGWNPNLDSGNGNSNSNSNGNQKPNPVVTSDEGQTVVNLGDSGTVRVISGMEDGSKKTLFLRFFLFFSAKCHFFHIFSDF